MSQTDEIEVVRYANVHVREFGDIDVNNLAEWLECDIEEVMEVLTKHNMTNLIMK